MEKDKVAELVQLIRSRRINANCFLRLLIRTYSKGPQSDTEQSVNTGVIVSQWASALLEVVVAHPIFAADIVHAVEVRECLLKYHSFSLSPSFLLLLGLTLFFSLVGLYHRCS